MARDNAKKIVGAGKGTSYLFSYWSSSVGDTMPMPANAKKETIKFNQQQTVDRMRHAATVINPMLKIWEDRNRSNIGSKLNAGKYKIR